MATEFISPDIQNAINFLIKEGYLLPNGQTTGKLTRLLLRTEFNKELPHSTAIIKDLDKISLKRFKELAEIPWQVVTNKGKANEFKYNVGQISRDAEVYFNRNVVGKINMEVLIQLTKTFYADERQARPTLTNFFLNGVWENMLENYKPKEVPKVQNESFTGERKL